MLQPKKQGNYFMLPNEIFNMDLTAGEIALYAFLMRMEDRKTYTCYPSFKTIGNSLQMSKNTVLKYVRLLEEKELIETEHTIVEHRDGSLRNGNLIYKILPIKQVVDSFHKRQLYNYGRKKKQ
ncbi:MAG: helix-turn-helix domain-containing protein [Ruminococcus sp.]